MSYSKKHKLLIAVTSPVSMTFFKGQIRYLQNTGFDVVIVCSPGWRKTDDVEYYPIVMEREISLLRDLYSLCHLVWLFVKIKPTIVNVGTPKAGLLVTIAAFLCRVPIRIYTCHGLRLETLNGFKRMLLVMTEKVAARCSHRVVCVSESLRQKYIDIGFSTKEKIIVIGAGSINGIDLERYSPLLLSSDNISESINKAGFDGDTVYIGFVGRLTKDKGIYELIEAFEILKPKFPHLKLILLGGFENGDPIDSKTQEAIIRDERIINTGVVTDTLPWYRMMRLLVLPTYREGLPTVLLEAGALGLPVVATKTTGCVDVIVDGKTGFLVPPGNAIELADAIAWLLSNPALAMTMGKNDRQFVAEHFARDKVWAGMAQFYSEMIGLNDK